MGQWLHTSAIVIQKEVQCRPVATMTIVLNHITSRKKNFVQQNCCTQRKVSRMKNQEVKDNSRNGSGNVV